MLLSVSNGDQDKSVEEYYEIVKGTLDYKFKQNLYYTVLKRIHQQIEAAVENEEETNFWGRNGEWKSLNRVQLGKKAIVLSCKEDILANFYDLRDIDESKNSINNQDFEVNSRQMAWVKAFAQLAGSESQKERNYVWDQLTDEGRLLKQTSLFCALGSHAQTELQRRHCRKYNTFKCYCHCQCDALDYKRKYS